MLFPSGLPYWNRLHQSCFHLKFPLLCRNRSFQCCQVPVENRYIHLSSDLNSPGTIYITMVNSFNGIVKKMNRQFLSTTESGSGIGLLSIQTTAERYHGSTRFYNEETEFISNIMLRLS
ncbi:GHKL domain-containing protein [Roseburia amylophila]